MQNSFFCVLYTKLINNVKSYLSYLPLSQFYFYICRVKFNINVSKHETFKRKINENCV